MSTPNDLPLQTGEELALALQAITSVAPPPPRTPLLQEEAFNAMSGGFVRPTHALDAFLSPDDHTAFEYADTKMVVAAQARSTPNGDFVLLAIAHDQEGRLSLTAGYRLYGEPADVAELARDARAAFQTFLERYAIPYRYGDRYVLFLPVVRFQLGPTGDFDLAKAFGLKMTPDTSWTVNTAVKFTPEGTVVAAWPFVVDSKRYEADVRARRR